MRGADSWIGFSQVAPRFRGIMIYDRWWLHMNLCYYSDCAHGRCHHHQSWAFSVRDGGPMVTKPRKDLTGNRYGKWTVIEFAGRTKNRDALWLCRCDCGTERIVVWNNLRDGVTNSCGCVPKNYFHGTRQSTNPLSKQHPRLYSIWLGMRRRCTCKSSSDYKNYGARGIKVCPEWSSFDVFVEWAIANGYADNLSIDRIDNDGNYEPSNCRWADAKTQANNRRQRSLASFDYLRHPVEILDDEGSVIARFRSETDAAEIIGLTSDISAIFAACTNKVSTAYGFRWRYAKGGAV